MVGRVANRVDPEQMAHLIGVYTVCSGLSVRVQTECKANMGIASAVTNHCHIMPLQHLIWVSFEWQSSAVLFSCKRKVELLANLVAKIDAGIVLFRSSI